MMDGLAERGQRRVEKPLFGLDHIGLDTYVEFRLVEAYIANNAKAIKRLEVFVLQRTRIRYLKPTATVIFMMAVS